MSEMRESLVSIRNLKVHFPQGRGAVVKAVDGIDLDIFPGETLGLVGESGCGKSTMGRAILQLHRPTEGSVRFDGTELTTLKGSSLRAMRKRMQIVFQDPYASLNPRMHVKSILSEPLRIHGVVGRKDVNARVVELMKAVGLSPKDLKRYPHEFSGGQRQRIGIARALAVDPDFIVCDEPISALDVSIQAQILNLMKDLQRERGLAYLFIAHDLSAVRHISDRIAVMYLGRIVEQGPAEEICMRPQHPYTQALISAVPIPDPQKERQRERIVLEGDVPSPISPPSGCSFHPRCPHAKDICREVTPERTMVQPGHGVTCHLVSGLLEEEEA
jgi:oligopeptide/dipeptide ABC transporter ATP-binding protein